jgi:Flp pilus assembly protein TadD
VASQPKFPPAWVQLGVVLEQARREGLNFDEAWSGAMGTSRQRGAVRFQHATAERHFAKAVLTALEPLGLGDFPDTLVARLARVQGLIALVRGDYALATKRFEEAARTWRRRAGAERPGDRYMALLADFGRPPVVGLIEPRREVERVEAELAALRETQPTTTP